MADSVGKYDVGDIVHFIWQNHLTLKGRVVGEGNRTTMYTIAITGIHTDQYFIVKESEILSGYDPNCGGLHEWLTV